jgi:hypothetical protein
VHAPLPLAFGAPTVVSGYLLGRRARRLWMLRDHLRPADVARWRHATRGLGRVTAPMPGLLPVRPFDRKRTAP